MTNKTVFILFYSNYCQHCKDFLIKLKKMNEDLYNNFTKIAVDGNSKIPKGITSVPTIIVPSHNHPLTDESVFMWLETIAVDYPCKKNVDNESEKTEEILPFIKNEMGYGFSDNFSFLESEGPLAHSFSFIGEDTNSFVPNNDAPIPTMDRPNPTKLEDSFNVNLEELKNNRDCDPFIMQAPQRK